MEIVHFVKTEEIAQRIQGVFDIEKVRLSELLPNSEIEHIGGTSIPGTISKGDLDINVRVKAEDFNPAIEKLKSIYDINQPDNWTSGFASFKDDSRNLGIQVTMLGSQDDYFVAQRDYLRDHPEMVQELNALKESFEGKSMDEYRKEKGEFFQRLLKN